MPSGPEPGLSAFHLDALSELGNIGAGNATTALSQMLGDRAIRMSSPAARLVELGQVGEELGAPDEPVAAVFLHVQGGVRGEVAFVLPDSAARSVLATLTGAAGEPGTEDGVPLPQRGLGDLTASALLELGNIVVTSYLNALSELTGLTLVPSVPWAAEDMLGAVVNSFLAEVEGLDDRILVIETRFEDEQDQVSGYLLFVPGRGQLPVLLAAMGLGSEGL